ncbi:gliding motility-associated C-terminal domain-containing protein [Aequorivita marina]|uniref:gliding motility-associated C-terminal domain-containing protein n=1 Tax=Aequorivita marina TaxID=3073654 RepID=UPI00287532E2|nr:gliding motility-associated C-terminal domain-containing protein [Aequorivita sp. S2608]MDS1298619.1 gliding motility-associated C-terminal domain-containing protein [Aequorivita sp. S2608]
MNKKLPLYLQSCLQFFKANLRTQALAIFSFFLLSFSAFAQGPGCPNVFAGEDIELEPGELCTDITASYLETGETTSYAVSSIPFDPPFPSTGGTPVSVNTDDVWSDAIDLPFDFCFFGETYTEMVIGSNAVISFDLANNTPGGYCTWSFDESVPDPGLFSAAIFGPFMDVDPSISGSGNINWTVFGEAPCRTMVVNFPGVPYYSCNDLSLTSQVVIYETTNVVEVYIEERSDQCTWNDGNAVVGIQNEGGTEGFTPPGRNTGNWSASNEAWRFTPDGDSNVDFSWLDADGTFISDERTINVCPTEATTVYTAQAIYTNCNGDVVTETDDITVTKPDSFTVDLGEDQEFCDVPSYEITAEITDGNPAEATFLWSTGETTQSITVTTSDTYSVDVTIGDVTVTDSVVVIFNELPQVDLGADIETCFAEPEILDAAPSNYNPEDATYVWSLNGEVIVEASGSTLTATDYGIYSVDVDVAGCATSDEIEILAQDDLVVTVDDDFQTCPKEGHTLTAKTRESDATYQWYLNGDLLPGETNSTVDIMIGEGTMGAQTYSVVISSGGCTGTDSVDVSLYDLTNCVITQGISPNGDGYNDSLELSWLNDRSGIVKLKIYNRYGTLVFDQRNYSNQWNGQTNRDNELPTGTYFYVIDLKEVDAVYGGRTTGWIYLNRKAN